VVDLTEILRREVKLAVAEALAEAGLVRAAKAPPAARVSYSQAEFARAIDRSNEFVRLLRAFNLLQATEANGRVTIPASELERLRRDGLPALTRAMRQQARQSARSAAGGVPAARIGAKKTQRAATTAPIFPQPPAAE